MTKGSMLTNRQITILDIIIREYTKTAEPVGSESLSFKKIKASPATIRNEMKNLEEEGYLFHPHTSAGRVPAEKGYKYFIENLMKEYKVKDLERQGLDNGEGGFSAQGGPASGWENTMKQRAKSLSNLTSEAIILSFGTEYIYYTGLTNLFSKPEFKEIQLVVSFSEILDRLDETVQVLFTDNFEDVKILIGDKNPFDKKCGAIVGKYSANNQEGVVGILGPMRMDYEKNMALLKYILNFLN